MIICKITNISIIKKTWHLEKVVGKGWSLRLSLKKILEKSFQASACAKRPGFLKNRVTEYVFKN